MDATNRQWVRSISGGSDNDPPEPAEPVEPAAPSFVPSDEFKQFQATVSGSLAAINDTLGFLRESAGRAAAPPAPVAPGVKITAAQFAEAVQTGDVPTIEAYERQTRQSFDDELVSPLRNTGLEAIANLTRDTTVASLPYYARFKKEIDAFVAGLPPQMRMNPVVYKTAHDAVVGANMPALIGEATEAAVRKANEPVPDTTSGGRRPGRVSGTDAVPTVEELMGPEAAQALAHRGLSADQHAQKLGYANWAAYAKLAVSE